RLRRARAADDEVCEVPLVRLPRSGRDILPSVNHEVGARLPRRGFPELHDVGRDDLGGPGRLRELDVQQAGDTAPEDEQSGPRPEAREPLTSNHAGERLDEGSLVIRKFAREKKHAVLHIDRRHTNVFREAARIEVRRSQSTSRRAWCGAYFCGFAPLTRSSASFGVARSCTTARMPRIMPTGFVDCQMLRPMSTPFAPSWIASYASSSASSSVSSFGPP